MTTASLRLVRLLAQLYPDVASSVVVMADSGIEAGRVYSEQQALTRWFFIVSEATKAGKLADLLATVSRDYPDHADLAALRQAAS